MASLSLADTSNDQVYKNPDLLRSALVTIASGFQMRLDDADSPEQKGGELTTLVTNFSLGIGVLAGMQPQQPSLEDIQAFATSIANEARSTILGWVEADAVQAGLGVTAMVIGNATQCGLGGRLGGSKKGSNKKRRNRKYKQKGGAGLDRYDVFTYILLAAAATGMAVQYGGTALEVAFTACNMVVQNVINYSIQLGLFKTQCATPADTAWNLFKQYTIGQAIPVETCIDKIVFNNNQVAKIKVSIMSLAGLLAPLTVYMSKDLLKSGFSAAFNQVKMRVSIPIVDMLNSMISYSKAAICSVAARGYQAVQQKYNTRFAARSAAAQAETEEAPQTQEQEQEAEQQQEAQVNAIDELKAQIQAAVDAGTPLEALVDQIKAQVDQGTGAQGTGAQGTGAEQMAEEGGAKRRRKRATRKLKGKRGKKSKTAKRGRKSKSLRKGKKAKGKRVKKTRRGRK